MMGAALVQDADETRYQLATDRFSMERSRTEGIQTRASQGMGVSGTLMTLFLVLGNSALSNLKNTNPLIAYLQGSLITGLILFAIDLLVFLYANRFANYRFDPSPSAITGGLAKLKNPDLMRQVTSNVVDATLYNHGLNDFKTGVIKVGYYLLGISVFAIVLFGIELVYAFGLQ